MVNIVCMMVIIIKLHRVVVLSVFSSSWSVELQKATVGLFPSLRKPKPPCRPLGIYAQFGLIMNQLSKPLDCRGVSLTQATGLQGSLADPSALISVYSDDQQSVSALLSEGVC